jgi:hypothetical protein
VKTVVKDTASKEDLPKSSVNPVTNKTKEVPTQSPPNTNSKDMKKHLVGWGITLVIVGALFTFLGSLLLGIPLIVLGFINFFICIRVLYLINGVVGIIVGLIFIAIQIVLKASWYRYFVSIVFIGWCIRDV